MRLISKDETGWYGWEGGLLYKAAPGEDVDEALRQKAKATDRGAAIQTEDNCLYGWGYTDARYKDGPYFWPFFIESDRFNKAGKKWVEKRVRIPEKGGSDGNPNAAVGKANDS